MSGEAPRPGEADGARDAGDDAKRDARDPASQQAPTVAGLKLKWQRFGAADDEASFGMWVLENPDVLLDLITQEEYEAHDERMPYFGAIWPSAESLVAHVLAGPRLEGVDLLDLGCGLGPCGFAAAARGASVTFIDWEPRAIEIVARSAEAQRRLQQQQGQRAAEHRLAEPRLVVADWRKPPPLGPFDRVLGADVLYEERNAPAVAAFLAAHLKPGAEAWLTDPGRPHARRFPLLAQQHGLEYRGSTTLPAMKHGIAIALHRFARPA